MPHSNLDFEKAEEKSKENKCWTYFRRNEIDFGFYHPQYYIRNPKGVIGYLLEK